jgi:hypothetical protein
MQEFILSHQWIIWLALIWTIPWKGIALWKAARNGHIAWFIILFIFNTLAILEIIYIFIFGKKKEENTEPENINQTNKPGNGTNLIRGL